MKDYRLTDAQVAALKRRFGHAVNVDQEIRNAYDYATQVHAGRPYSNYARFVWNWLKRAEDWGAKRRGGADQRAKAKQEAMRQAHEEMRAKPGVKFTREGRRMLSKLRTIFVPIRV